MNRIQRLNGFKFNNQFIIHKKISFKIVANLLTLIEDLNRPFQNDTVTSEF